MVFKILDISCFGLFHLHWVIIKFITILEVLERWVFYEFDIKHSLDVIYMIGDIFLSCLQLSSYENLDFCWHS